MNYQAPPPNNKGSVITTVAIAGMAASIAASLFLMYQINGMKDEAEHSRTVLQGEIDTLKESSTAISAASRKHMDELKDDLDTRSRQLAAQANQAKKEAVSYADEKSKVLESEQQKTAQQVGQVSSAISEVSRKADTTAAKVENVNSDVSGVKQDLSATKVNLE